MDEWWTGAQRADIAAPGVVASKFAENRVRLR
jgi:hypothetical protein